MTVLIAVGVHSLAMKVFDAQNDVAIDSFVSELQAYDALQDLQGSVIPQLHSFGRMPHSGCPAIATYWAGTACSSADSLSDDVLAAAEQGLQAMHERHVSHGDVGLSKMLLDTDRLVFCGFGYSSIDASPRDCQEDFAMLAACCH